MINAATEQADTRAWQTIPHSIYYSRMKLTPGPQQVSFTPHAAGGSKSYTFNLDIKKGETSIHTFHTMDIDPNFRFNPYTYNSY